ncbi:MAG: hypothetical protein KGL95_06645 [Patescibacteria group bacterium]|nr:hypothetical protein [Patescibacteria group bacterium]
MFAIAFFVFQSLIQSAYAEYKELNLQITVSQYSARIIEQINPRTIVSTITIQAISNHISDVLATDQDNVVLATSQEGNTIKIDTLGAAHVTLRYDANIVTKNSSIWIITYNSSNINSTVILPPVSDVVSVSNIPNDMNGNTITMPAGEVSISYVTRTVNKNTFIITKNGTTSEADVLSASKIEKFSFDNKANDITFSLDEQAPVLVILSKALLGSQYTITLDGNPVAFKDYYQNATHEWIRIDPLASGMIKIAETTVPVPEFLSAPMLFFTIALISLLVVIRICAILNRH